MIKNGIQYECNSLKVIIQLQIGQEIALFFKFRHLKFIALINVML